MNSIEGPAYLRGMGGPKGVSFTTDDFEAMDIALSLVPEARIAALAVILARKAGSSFPVADAAGVIQLLGDDTVLEVCGRKIDPSSIEQFFVAGDFPIENESALASRVYVALQRCSHRAQLQRTLEHFDRDLSAPSGALRRN